MFVLVFAMMSVNVECLRSEEEEWSYSSVLYSGGGRGAVNTDNQYHLPLSWPALRHHTSQGQGSRGGRAGPSTGRRQCNNMYRKFIHSLRAFWFHFEWKPWCRLHISMDYETYRLSAYIRTCSSQWFLDTGIQPLLASRPSSPVTNSIQPNTNKATIESLDILNKASNLNALFTETFQPWNVSWFSVCA